MYNLKNKYSVAWTCDQTVTLRVTSRGKTKEIVDYGLCGTNDLRAIYNELFEIADQMK